MATSTEPLIVYDKKELASFARVIRNMSDIAVDETKRRVGELAQRELNEIRSVAKSRGKVADRVAQGGKVKKSSLLGEISFGFASQRFSGGATTQQLWGGYEFGSTKFKQFPIWSGRGTNGGSAGYFIYPTLRAEQPHIIAQWETAFTKILKEW